MINDSTQTNTLDIELPCSPDVWKEIDRAWPRHVYPPSVALSEQGLPVQTVYLIEEGIVKLSRWEDTARRVVIGLRFPGWVLGATAAILKEASAASAETITRCSVRQASVDTFLRTLKTKPEVSWHVHRSHSRELHDQAAQLAGLGSLSAQRRLERLLCELLRLQKPPHNQGHAVRLVTPLKQWELAGAIMTSPQHLSRLFRRLEQQHVVRREKGWLIVLDPMNLALANNSRRRQ